MKRNLCDWINIFCKKRCDWIKKFEKGYVTGKIIYPVTVLGIDGNRLGIDLGTYFSLIINKVTDGTDFLHMIPHPYFFSVFFFWRKVRNEEKTILLTHGTLQPNTIKGYSRNRFKNNILKQDLVRECRETGLRFTNESLREAARILHTLKFINNETKITLPIDKI